MPILSDEQIKNSAIQLKNSGRYKPEQIKDFITKAKAQQTPVQPPPQSFSQQHPILSGLGNVADKTAGVLSQGVQGFIKLANTPIIPEVKFDPKTLRPTGMTRAGVGTVLGQGVSAVASVVGGAVGGVMELATQGIKAAQGKGFDLSQVGKTMQRSAQAEQQFWQPLGEQVPGMAALGGLGKIVNVAVMVGQGYTGSKDLTLGVKMLRSGDKNKRDEAVTLITNGLLAMVPALISGKHLTKAEGGLILDPDFKAQVQAEIGNIKESITGETPVQSAVKKGTAIYREVMRPTAGEIKKIEIKKGGDINDSYRYMAEHNIKLGKSIDGKTLDTKFAIDEQVVPKLDALDDQLEAKLVSLPEQRFDLNKTKENAFKKIDASDKLQEEKDAEKATVIRLLDPEIRVKSGEIPRAGSESSQTTAKSETNGLDYNKLKRRMWKAGYDQGVPNKQAVARMIGNLIKTDIEVAYKDGEVQNINGEMGKLLTVRSLLENAHGRKISGSVFGRAAARMTGAVLGAHAIPGPMGVLTGLAGEHIAGKIQEYAQDPTRLTERASAKIEQAKGLPSSILKKKLSKEMIPGLMGVQDVSAFAPRLAESKGKLADQIMAQHPDIQLKRDVPATDIHGKKVVIPEGEALTPYELKGNKVLLQDGQTYIVSKNQFQNIKGNAVSGEVKEFAPELKGTEETLLGGKPDWQGNELYANGERVANVGYSKGEGYFFESDFSEGTEIFKTKAEAMKAAVADTLGVQSGRETKYSSYQLPGGKNYREIIIKAPPRERSTYHLVKGNEVIGSYPSRDAAFNAMQSKGGGVGYSIQPDIKAPDFVSSHYPDEKNPISHLRIKEYESKKYGEVTFMEELQSDWAKEGRSKGFAQKATELPEGSTFEQGNDRVEVWNNNRVIGEGQTFQGAKQNALDKLSEGIPNNPLLKNWQELSIKRALKEAVNNKSEYFAWINGEQTSARYNLATHLEDVKWNWKNDVNKIELAPKGEGPIVLGIDRKGEILTSSKHQWTGKKLDEVLGKGLADSIMAKESGTLSGEGLKFGGEWANNLYDKQVGNIVSDLTGARVEVLDMGLPIDSKTRTWNIVETGKPPHSFKTLTPENIKIGKEVHSTEGAGNSYIITDVLGDGKFKAVPKDYIKNIQTTRNDTPFKIGKDKFFLDRSQEQSFDISTKKTTQQGIKITPEIRAMIKGEAPVMKKPSGILDGIMEKSKRPFLVPAR